MRTWTLKQILEAYDLEEEENRPDFSLTIAVTTDAMVMTVALDGTISVEDSSDVIVQTFISQNDVYRFFIDYYDWAFLSRGVLTELPSFQEIWQLFWEHKREQVARAYSDLQYKYIPIYNYDRSEVNYYNLSDNTDKNYLGTATNGRQYQGSVTTANTGKSVSSSDVQNGMKAGDTSASWSKDGSNYTISASTSAIAGSDFKDVRFVNSYEDDTGTAPDNATDSVSHEGTAANTFSGASAGVTTIDYSGHGYTDTESFTNRKDELKNDKDGQTGIRAFGNIGVTTATAMVKEDVAYRMLVNLQDVYFKQFIDEYFFAGGDDDEY